MDPTLPVRAGDTGVIRAASLRGFAPLVEELGGQSQELLERFGIPADALTRDDGLIPNLLRLPGRHLDPDAPRPLGTLPAWRGAVCRLGDVLPRLGLGTLQVMTAQGRRVQRRMLRRR